jgi:hypothetical protein
MSEAAKVFWIVAPEMATVKPGRALWWSGDRQRQFESLENAVRFVMESLPDCDRSTAMIQTDNASIQYGDIERIHAGMMM